MGQRPLCGAPRFGAACRPAPGRNIEALWLTEELEADLCAAATVATLLNSKATRLSNTVAIIKVPRYVLSTSSRTFVEPQRRSRHCEQMR